MKRIQGGGGYRKQEVCNRFNNDPRGCHYGSSCRFLHGTPDYQRVQNEFDQDALERSLSEKDSRGYRGGSGSRRHKPQAILPKLMELNPPLKRGFRAISIFPTRKELLDSRPENIPINKIEGPYEDIEEYLETHYKLLREDFIRPLREGIQLWEAKKKTNSMDIDTDTEKTEGSNDQMNLRVYVDVNIVGVTLSSIGVLHRISFRTCPSEKIHWAQNKRLIPGTLVVLTNDDFKTIKLATVVNRSLELLKKPHDLQIDVLFRSENADFIWDKNYTMFESTASYFEAYRHVLKVLQELDPITMPFESHIVELDKDIKAPEYLETRSTPTYEFGTDPSFQNLEQFTGRSSFNILEPWPPLEKINDGLYPLDKTNFGLHISQYDALKRMLTSRLALIQGPPGTGKTYMGLTAVRILLENLGKTNNAIVISCQTNHALDQFLEGVQEFEPSIVRLGSRSTTPSIMQRTLYKIRQEYRNSDEWSIRNPEINKLFREKDSLETKMLALFKEVGNPCVSLKYVEEKRLLKQKQISNLKEDDWVTSSSTSNDGDRDYIREWLDRSFVTHHTAHNDDAYQVIQIIQGEQITDDDDDEIDEETLDDVVADFGAMDDAQMVHGKYVHLRSETFVSSDMIATDSELKKYSSMDDVFSIPSHVRATMHNKWRRERMNEVTKDLRKLNDEYLALLEKIKRERIREDLLILKNSRVIGMTTTAAAKYHELLVNLKSKIVVIEEAAETLEAHVITALTPSTQHLILIGDHQQLRPNTAVHDLAKDHFLNVSLFERLIENELPFTRLIQQRRMRPEIRELLSPIYGDILEDHPSVGKYPNVPGFFENLFFFDHQEEESIVKDTKSRTNEFEAKMCAKLAVYLINGGYEPSNITILSMYSGQRKLIQRRLSENARMSYFSDEIKSVRVSSVDGFQGEENNVIILSLVRSRKPRNNIGFLSVSNRVCVSLSRARHGMYIFGNETQLRMQSDLWKKIIGMFNKKKLCDQSIDVYCTKHSSQELGMVAINVQWEADIPPEGGCKQKCGELMICGHTCPKDCHTYPHDKFKCREKCRGFPCGHPCNKECKEDCGECNFMVPVNPPCGHQKEIECHKSSQYKCDEQCIKKLRCGHRCIEICSSPWCICGTCSQPYML